jgi:hypothetical protein
VPKPKTKAEKVVDEAPEEPEQASEAAPEDAEKDAASEEGKAEDGKVGCCVELHVLLCNAIYLCRPGLKQGIYQAQY